MTNLTNQEWVTLGDLSNVACLTIPNSCGSAGAALSLWIRILDCPRYSGIITTQYRIREGFCILCNNDQIRWDLISLDYKEMVIVNYLPIVSCFENFFLVQKLYVMSVTQLVAYKQEWALGENCALAANQSVDCRTTILFTISLNSVKVRNRGFNWPVFSVGMHKKSPNDKCEVENSIRNCEKYELKLMV